jgi:hypothetical protein
VRTPSAQGTGIGNNIPDPDFTPAEDGAVKSNVRLGGLLRRYYRQATWPSNENKLSPSFRRGPNRRDDLRSHHGAEAESFENPAENADSLTPWGATPRLLERLFTFRIGFALDFRLPDILN